MNLFYKLSDVNKGKPKQFCYAAAEDAAHQYGKVLGIGSLVIMSLLALTCLCNFVICCSKDRKHLRMRERFVFVNNQGYSAV